MVEARRGKPLCANCIHFIEKQLSSFSLDQQKTDTHTHTHTHSHTPGLEHTLTWCLGYHSTTCTERHPGTSHSSADGRLGNLSACYRQRWQETWPLSGGTQNRPLGRVPWPSCREPRVLTLAERLWAAVLELRAQPAHTGAHRTATASVQ